MKPVSSTPLMTSWEGVRASLHDQRLHQNQGSWRVKTSSRPTVEHQAPSDSVRSAKQAVAGRPWLGRLCESAKKSLRQGCRQLLCAHSPSVSPTSLSSFSFSSSSSPLRAALCCYAIIARTNSTIPTSGKDTLDRTNAERERTVL